MCEQKEEFNFGFLGLLMILKCSAQGAFKSTELNLSPDSKESETLRLEYRKLDYCRVLESFDICSTKTELKEEDLFNLSEDY